MTLRTRQQLRNARNAAEKQSVDCKTAKNLTKNGAQSGGMARTENIQPKSSFKRRRGPPSTELVTESFQMSLDRIGDLGESEDEALPTQQLIGTAPSSSLHSGPRTRLEHTPRPPSSITPHQTHAALFSSPDILSKNAASFSPLSPQSPGTGPTFGVLAPKLEMMDSDGEMARQPLKRKADSLHYSEVDDDHSADFRRSPGLQRLPPYPHDFIMSSVLAAGMDSRLDIEGALQRGPLAGLPSSPLYQDFLESQCPLEPENGQKVMAEPPIHKNKTILEHCLASMTNNEIAKWEGWLEVESEPAFLNTIMRHWGVKDVQVEEIISVDTDDNMEILSKPIYGLVFLFEYVDEEEEEETVDSNQVWFANQTADNSCASVAMLNILMNLDIDVGDTLRRFKEETQDLSEPLRGWKLATNTAIRSAHNYLARRMDCLSADLGLDYSARTAAATFMKSRRRNVRRKKTTTPQKKKRHNDPVYHFIAYVESSGLVWELDGLRRRPVCIDVIPDSSDSNDNCSRWVPIALEHIRRRIDTYDGSPCFNLLALCRSSTASLHETMARILKSMYVLDRRMRVEYGPEWKNLVPAESFSHGVPVWCQGSEGLASCGLTAADIDAAEVLDDRLRETSETGTASGMTPSGDDSASAMEVEKGASGTGATITLQEAAKLHSQFISRLECARSELILRESDAHEAAERVELRKQNWMPAIHAWLKALHERGVLEAIAHTA